MQFVHPSNIKISGKGTQQHKSQYCFGTETEMLSFLAAIWLMGELMVALG